MNKQLEALINRLKTKKFRITKSRTSLLDVLINTHSPLSAQDILKEMKRNGTTPNKTTVYRELQALEQEQIVKTLTLNAEKKLYELLREHHHHIICQICGQIQDVHMQDELDIIERHIEKKYQFMTAYHSLEFFGVCKSCQTKAKKRRGK